LGSEVPLQLPGQHRTCARATLLTGYAMQLIFGSYPKNVIGVEGF
jgi:hypothetical protein